MGKYCQNNYPSVKIIKKIYYFRQGLLNALTHNINIYGTYSVHMYTNIYSSTYCIFFVGQKRGVWGLGYFALIGMASASFLVR